MTLLLLLSVIDAVVLWTCCRIASISDARMNSYCSSSEENKKNK